MSCGKVLSDEVYLWDGLNSCRTVFTNLRIFVTKFLHFGKSGIIELLTNNGTVLYD